MPESTLRSVEALRLQEAARAERHAQEAQEIITEMDHLRETLTSGIGRLAELSQKLRTHALRQRDDLTSGYLAYSNAYSRICGAMNQGLRRTATMGRVLDAAKATQEETRQREAQEDEYRRMRAQTREVEKLSLPARDDFDLVYGEETD